MGIFKVFGDVFKDILVVLLTHLSGNSNNMIGKRRLDTDNDIAPRLSKRCRGIDSVSRRIDSGSVDDTAHEAVREVIPAEVIDDRISEDTSTVSSNTTLPTIPKRTRSDNAIWRLLRVPSVHCLVVHARDDGTYYLVPRPSTGVQIYTAKHLSYSHAVVKLEAFLVETFRPGHDVCSVVWYDPRQDHHDEFFIILNKPTSIATALGDDFPFDALLAYTSEHAVSTSNAGQVTRQRMAVNRGYTGTQSMGIRDTNGQPMPLLKQGSTDAPIVSSMVCASRYFWTLRPAWNGNVPFTVPENRVLRFGDRIGAGIVFEGCTHTTDGLCSWHTDS